MRGTRSNYRSLMAQWMGKVGFELQPLADYVLERIKQGERVFADETTLPTLAPGSGKTQKAWLWAYARDDRPFGGAGPPMVAYRFEDSRSGDCVARHLAGYTGILQVDGYSAYTRLAKTGTGASNETVTLAGCWAHLRRRFYELHLNGSSRLATQPRQPWPRFGRLKVTSAAVPRQRRMAARQQRSAAIVAELFNLWEMELPRISGKSKLAEAIRYATSRRKVLECFLTDGRVEIDSNIVERAIRPQTITRKNALFAGSDGGGRTWATIATLLQTAKMNDVDPLTWLTQTLQRIANGWPISQIEKLMPWNYKA
jgi:transposase